MTKKSDSSWFQFDSNAVCTVTHIRKRIFPKLACYVTLPDHFVLRMHIGNLISRNQNFMTLADSLHKSMSKC